MRTLLLKQCKNNIISQKFRIESSTFTFTCCFAEFSFYFTSLAHKERLFGLIPSMSFHFMPSLYFEISNATSMRPSSMKDLICWTIKSKYLQASCSHNTFFYILQCIICSNSILCHLLFCRIILFGNLSVEKIYFCSIHIITLFILAMRPNLLMLKGSV